MSKEADIQPRLDGVRVLVFFGGVKLFGQERGNIEVFRNLVAMGAKVRVITTSRGGTNDVQRELQKHGIEWTTAPFGYTWHNYLLGRHFYYGFLNLYSILAVSWRVWREIRCWKPTHLYTMNWNYFTYAYPALQMTRLPLIWRAGDAPPEHSRMHRWIARQIFKRTSTLVCNSHFLERLHRTLGGDKFSIEVIHNHPSARITMGDVGSVEVPAGATTLLYVGQISQHKGLDLLIETTRRLIDCGDNVVLLIVGESSWGDGLLPQLQANVGRYKLENRVKFLGYREDVPELMRRASIHVCPSIWDEPSPNVVFEAKREGVPSVVFPSGGLPELIEHKRDGYVCESCSVEALVEGIRFFLDDPGARREAATAARRSLDKRFGLERFRQQWAKVFLESTL